MAVTMFRGGTGAKLTAVGDKINGNLKITKVDILKTTSDTVTFKDGAGNVILLTGALTADVITTIQFNGWETQGFEYDAVGSGSAIVYVYTRRQGVDDDGAR